MRAMMMMRRMKMNMMTMMASKCATLTARPIHQGNPVGSNYEGIRTNRFIGKITRSYLVSVE